MTAKKKMLNLIKHVIGVPFSYTHTHTAHMVLQVVVKREATWGTLVKYSSRGVDKVGRINLMSIYGAYISHYLFTCTSRAGFVRVSISFHGNKKVTTYYFSYLIGCSLSLL